MKAFLKAQKERLLRSDHIKVGRNILQTNPGDPMKMSLYPYEPVETSLVKQHVKENHTVLDIGANVGYYTLLFAGQGATVHSYEPEPDNFKLLLYNVENNKLDNVKLYNAAVSDFEGMTDLYISKGAGQHRITPSRFCNHSIKVPVTKINLDHVDFAKIDTEGGEVRVLDGMKTMPDKLIVEFNHSNIMEHQSDPKRLFIILRNHKIQIITKQGLDEFDYDRLCKSEMALNLFCS